MDEAQSTATRMGRAALRGFFKLLIVGILGFCAWTWGALKYSYAKGERAGFIQKISKKGWLCKTWEGELAMANLPGTMPQIFSFSVRDEAVAQKLMQSAGERVSLTYDQHRGIPTSCFGETAYFVVAVTPINESTPPKNP